VTGAEPVALATRLLQALARSDLAELDLLCADDILLLGTDVGEVWDGKRRLMDTFGGAYDLAVAWTEPPVVRGEAVIGRARFVLDDGSSQDARVTMVFAAGRCVHAHYSQAIRS
jgi:hypothetical protein